MAIKSFVSQDGQAPTRGREARLEDGRGKGHVLSHKREELIHESLNCSLFCGKKDHSREKISVLKWKLEQTQPTFPSHGNLIETTIKKCFVLFCFFKA